MIGNRNELKQLLINIMKNGIESMPNGGILKVTAQNMSGNAIITIQDEGNGISKQQLKKLGQPYYSTKTKGTGLGLLICFDIIKRMNGEYKIKSTQRVGTTFEIVFPI